MKNILVVGSVNADLTIYTDRLPHPGETVEGSGFSAAFGGKGAKKRRGIVPAVWIDRLK